MITIRRLVVVAAVVGAAAGLSVSPASADRPETFTDLVQFDEPDPCEPSQSMTTTLLVEVSAHVGHPKNVVLHAKITAETDRGYSGSGVVTGVITGRSFAETQRVVVANAETGQRYIVKLHVSGGPGGVAVDDFDIVCVRGLV